MKSIKPGRGPSAMNGIGSIAAIVFGVIWTIVSASSGDPLFPLFGVIFIIMGIVQAVYHFKNATGENRFSEYDITDELEESDPFNDRFNENTLESDNEYEIYRDTTDNNTCFCPYCGSKVKSDFVYCKKCGKKIN